MIVASTQEAKVSAIREAFQIVFGKATVEYVTNATKPDSIRLIVRVLGVVSYKLLR